MHGKVVALLGTLRGRILARSAHASGPEGMHASIHSRREGGVSMTSPADAPWMCRALRRDDNH